MDGGLLSLKWNNHRSTFFYVLSNVRKKECYTDVTLACDGKFYPVHKLVLSTCSEYFEQMFEHTQCKHPVIVLKDIRCEELESLLSYMYVGEVNVVQEKLSGLIKAAECLRIKGLAVPDEEPCSSGGGSKPSASGGREKRTSDNSVSSEPKRRRQDDGSSNFRQSSNSNVNSNRAGVEDRRKSQDHQSSSSSSNKFRNSTSSSGNVNNSSRSPSASGRERLLSPSHSNSSNNNAAQNVDVKSENAPDPPDDDEPQPVNPDDGTEPVKQEPVDLDAVYLSDSNSASESKDILMDNFGGDDGGGQQHFMDELLGQNSGSDQGHMGVGDYGDGEGSSGPSAGGSQQQQHMVGWTYGGATTTSATTTAGGGAPAKGLSTTHCSTTTSTTAQPTSSSMLQQQQQHQHQHHGMSVLLSPSQLKYPASVTATSFSATTLLSASATIGSPAVSVTGAGYGAGESCQSRRGGGGNTDGDVQVLSSATSTATSTSAGVGNANRFNTAHGAIVAGVSGSGNTGHCLNKSGDHSVTLSSSSPSCPSPYEYMQSPTAAYTSHEHPCVPGSSILLPPPPPHALSAVGAGVTGRTASASSSDMLTAAYGRPHVVHGIPYPTGAGAACSPLSSPYTASHSATTGGSARKTSTTYLPYERHHLHPITAVTTSSTTPLGVPAAPTQHQQHSLDHSAPGGVGVPTTRDGGSALGFRSPPVSEQKTTVSCPHCSRIFSKIGFVKRHVKEIHGVEYQVT